MTLYTPYYCEENIWWLCQDPRLAGARREVVFISNAQRACALFHQRAAAAPDGPVLWDYHVVLAVEGERGFEVWDLDCTLGAPLAAVAWLEATFGPVVALPALVHPRFRVVDAETYVASFSSDREHMRSPEGGWHAPPPEWPRVLRGEPNLDRFIDLERPFLGEVLDLPGLCARWGCALANAPSERA